MELAQRVLADPDLDHRLQRDGFVTFPLLDKALLVDARGAYGDLHGWEGTGFETDLVVPDPEYRRATAEAIGRSFDHLVTPLFVDHEPFLRSYICKFPGEDSSLYVHRDWMYVDERTEARTYVAWIPLQDIAGHNGQLRVLRGSHLLDRSLRGTDLIAPWIEHTDVIEPRLLSVPVRAGDVVVFDNALVHSSFPNHTDEPRLVAAIGLKPKGAPLVHFRRSSATEAERYDVDDDFFCTATPQGLMQAPPDLPVAERLPIEAATIEASELARRLDAGRLARLDRVQRTASNAGAAVTSGARAAVEAMSSWRAAIAARGRAEERPTLRERAAAIREAVTTKAAIGVLAVNEAMIVKFGPRHPAIWDPAQFPWAAEVEAAFPEIRQEVEALLAGPKEIPHIEDVVGGIPQGNVGPWRTFVLMHTGTWIDWNCERCPRTTEVVRGIPGLTLAGFSVLEPGTHITSHRGPNKGALRYQLGVIVPGRDGDCRIRVGDEMLIWRDGEGVMFDFTVEHEAWNDSDGIRVLLMLEVITPLPRALAIPNRLAQRAMGWFPTTRAMRDRLLKLEPTLTRTAA